MPIDSVRVPVTVGLFGITLGFLKGLLVIPKGFGMDSLRIALDSSGFPLGSFWIPLKFLGGSTETPLGFLNDSYWIHH